ncbi:MAG: hypothetical protein HKN01_00085 [Acidimicrobiia bacterium]|nr:hypothetical protein [Acidimicrobiia bacterium]
MEWVEVRGKSVESCVEEALNELGVGRDRVEVEVVQEPKPGILGFGSKDAVVKVSVRQDGKKRRRRRGRGRRGNGENGQSEAKKTEDQGRNRGGGRRDGGGERQGGRSGRDAGRGGGRDSGGRGGRDSNRDGGRGGRDRANAGAGGGGGKPQTQRQSNKKRDEAEPRMTETPDIAEQEQVAKDFLTGLVTAVGLEGDITTRVEDDVLFMDISGEQTQALVGAKGAVMQSVLELTRTVVQRKTHGAPRMRLDIAGYGERRREALRIYAAKLADELLEHGGEIMLEPMNPADRKVVHDAIADIDDIRSFSEGEDPSRSVVLTLEDGVEPRGSSSSDEE